MCVLFINLILRGGNTQFTVYLLVLSLKLDIFSLQHARNAQNQSRA
jgi:hypothetical protein